MRILQPWYGTFLWIVGLNLLILVGRVLKGAPSSSSISIRIPNTPLCGSEKNLLCTFHRIQVPTERPIINSISLGGGKMVPSMGYAPPDVIGRYQVSNSPDLRIRLRVPKARLTIGTCAADRSIQDLKDCRIGRGDIDPFGKAFLPFFRKIVLVVIG